MQIFNVFNVLLWFIFHLFCLFFFKLNSVNEWNEVLFAFISTFLSIFVPVCLSRFFIHSRDLKVAKEYCCCCCCYYYFWYVLFSWLLLPGPYFLLLILPHSYTLQYLNSHKNRWKCNNIQCSSHLTNTAIVSILPWIYSTACNNNTNNNNKAQLLHSITRFLLLFFDSLSIAIPLSFHLW